LVVASAHEAVRQHTAPVSPTERARQRIETKGRAEIWKQQLRRCAVCVRVCVEIFQPCDPLTRPFCRGEQKCDLFDLGSRNEKRFLLPLLRLPACSLCPSPLLYTLSLSPCPLLTQPLLTLRTYSRIISVAASCCARLHHHSRSVLCSASPKHTESQQDHLKLHLGKLG
jgi:hypothetical protein